MGGKERLQTLTGERRAQKVAAASRTLANVGRPLFMWSRLSEITDSASSALMQAENTQRLKHVCKSDFSFVFQQQQDSLV